MRNEGIVPSILAIGDSWFWYPLPGGSLATSLARVVASRSTCDRKQVGAVIVRDKIILSTGYNGSIRGTPHCDEAGHLMEDGHCVRTVHAEANAIVQAATERGLAVAALLATTSRATKTRCCSTVRVGVGTTSPLLRCGSTPPRQPRQRASLKPASARREAPRNEPDSLHSAIGDSVQHWRRRRSRTPQRDRRVHVRGVDAQRQQLGTDHLRQGQRQPRGADRGVLRHGRCCR